jgi:CPA1 family monovalent cation:H+ antiporter
VSEAQRFLLLLVGLSAAAVLLRAVSRGARMPYAVVLAAGGIAVGLIPGVPRQVIGPDLILLAFVPGLVFEATLTLDLGSLRQVLVPVGLLATAGVAITVVVIGGLTHLLLGLRLPDAMLLGAVLAPTDPIAVVSVMRRQRAPGRLAALLEGESLLNDGTGVAVFSALLVSIGAGALSAGDVIGRFALESAGGAAVGLAVGALGVALLRAFTEPQVEILITLVLAYGGYLAADLLGLSGIIAVVAVGIVVAGTGRRLRLHGEELTDFWAVLAFVLNAILFLLVGTALPAHRLLEAAGMTAAAFGLMVAARALPVYGLLLAADPRGRRIPWRWRHLVFWAGLRGALSVALALSLTGNPRVSPEVPTIAYGVVVLSLLVQGGLAGAVARRLRLGGMDRAGAGGRPADPRDTPAGPV